MVPLQNIRQDPESIKAGARRKGESAPIDEILELDKKVRELTVIIETARAEQRRLGALLKSAPSESDRRHLATFKSLIRDNEDALRSVEEQRDSLLLFVPNVPHPTVPDGNSEADNVTIRTWGNLPSFGFTPAPHYEIGEKLGIFDFERAVKISGARFALLRGAGAQLERALITFMLDVAVREHGYTEILPPYLVRRETMVGSANLPKFEDDAFRTTGDLFLIPTAEVPVTNIYRDEILDEQSLPLAHVAFSPCFRSEAGSAGKDTRGYIRLHQFHKVEMVRFTTPEKSLDELELLTSHAENILQRLNIPYRVLLMCAGDTGFAQWKKYDIEAWAPGLNRWLEVSSCSVFSDFQARRANIRYRSKVSGKLHYVHTLNGSGLALPRTLAAILENFQTKDGRVTIPPILRPYMHGQEILQ